MSKRRRVGTIGPAALVAVGRLALIVWGLPGQLENARGWARGVAMFNWYDVVLAAALVLLVVGNWDIVGRWIGGGAERASGGPTGDPGDRRRGIVAHDRSSVRGSGLISGLDDGIDLHDDSTYDGKHTIK